MCPTASVAEFDVEDDEEGVDDKDDGEEFEPGMGNPEAAALS